MPTPAQHFVVFFGWTATVRSALEIPLFMTDEATPLLDQPSAWVSNLAVKKAASNKFIDFLEKAFATLPVLSRKCEA